MRVRLAIAPEGPLRYSSVTGVSLLEMISDATSRVEPNDCQPPPSTWYWMVSPLVRLKNWISTPLVTYVVWSHVLGTWYVFSGVE